jgi:hypothetical protein
MATANRFGGGGTIGDVQAGWRPPPGEGAEDQDQDPDQDHDDIATWEAEGAASAWERMLEALDADDAGDAPPERLARTRLRR